MEILNNLYYAFTSENPNLIQFMSIFFTFIEVTIYMLFFTTLLSINASKKQKITYVILSTLVGLITNFFIPKPFSNIITIIFMPLAIKYIFNSKLLKGIVAEFLILIFVTILEQFIARFLLLFLHLDYTLCATIPIYRLSISALIYLLVYVVYRFSKKYNVNINMFDKLDKKNKIIIFINVLLANVVLLMQMFLQVFYVSNFPLSIALINILSLVAYFLLSIYSLVKALNLEKAKEDLEVEKNYNKTLQILHDSVRAFKHDFSNIIAGIGGYVETDDLEGLKKYYHELLQECGQVNNLSSLSPENINNPAVYSVLANKYYKADTLGIKINLECFIDFNKLDMPIYEFTRIVGILLDNAIEASSECDNKLINVLIRSDMRQHMQILSIENTYKEKDVDIAKIYKKGFSSKPKNTGLGLWEVNKIVSKHKNVYISTSKSNEFFRQELIIS